MPEPGRGKTTTRRTRGAAAGAGGRRAHNKSLIQQRIVAAALALFQSKGFDATTTKAIARKAAVAEGTVFNYFRTKEDIALHFFELEVDHAIATVRGSARLRTAPLEEKLFALIQSQFAYLAPYERFIGAALVEALRPGSPLGFLSHKALALRHRYVGFVQDLIEESQAGRHSFVPVSWWAPEAFWIYYLGALLFWLHDTSPGKQNTLAFLDSSLRVGVAMLNGRAGRAAGRVRRRQPPAGRRARARRTR
jgi:AcrR family transcriptional regulator